jgi:wobble nucleotide-excising tRNase
MDQAKIISDKIRDLISLNNKKSNSLIIDKKKLHNKILMSDLLKFLRVENIASKKEAIEQAIITENLAIDNYEELKKKIDIIEKKIKDFKLQQKDESKGAERINEYLNKYFGSDEIQLMPESQDGLMSYLVTRNGGHAKNLSDGECSLIAFCYFIASIEDLFTEIKIENNERGSKPIIYIDDPISSLDNNHVFFIFSIIDEKIASSKKLHQLFVSTHNLDFLKLIRRLNGLDGDKAFFTIEKLRKHNDAISTITPMQPHLKEFVTEFNCLFAEMYEMYKEVRGNRAWKITNTYNTFYRLPNTIRKFLELYLFYRYPSQDNLTTKLKLMFDDNVPTLINRIINEYSHLSYIERAWKPFDVPELETCVKVIFVSASKDDV